MTPQESIHARGVLIFAQAHSTMDQIAGLIVDTNDAGMFSDQGECDRVTATQVAAAAIVDKLHRNATFVAQREGTEAGTTRPSEAI